MTDPSVLATVERRPGSSASEVAAVMGIHVDRIGFRLRRLERVGLVWRSAEWDGAGHRPAWRWRACGAVPRVLDAARLVALDRYDEAQARWRARGEWAIRDEMERACARREGTR